MNSKFFKIPRFRSSNFYARSIVIAFASFLFTLGITYLLWSSAQKNALNDAEEHFHSSNHKTTYEIENRMHAYENTLQSSAALLNTVERMNHQKWKTYISSLNLTEHYPGFQGIGFSKIIPENELSTHISHMRQAGFQNYRITPSGKRPEYHAIVYLEPLDTRNAKAIGYDMYTNPIRRQAMSLSRDTGEPVLSGKVKLVQEEEHDIQAGFLMYVPFYHTNKTMLTPTQRREKLQGFVFAPFRANNLMNEILHDKGDDISIKMYDGTSLGDETLLFQKNSVENNTPLFRETIHTTMYGRTWTIVFETLPSFNQTIDKEQSRLIILAGLPISFLLLLTILSFSQTAEQARTLARQMTVEIRNLNAELENMINSAPNPIIVHSEDGSIVKINQAWSEICGYTHEETPTVDIWIDKVYKEHQEEIKEYIRNLYNITQKVDEGDFSFYSKSGQKITWQFSSAPFGTINGKKTVISSAMDVTELKNKDAMLMMQSRHAAMGEMISMIAHQWRQPLASISTISGTLNLQVMLGQYDQDHFAEKLNLISDLALDLSDTINDFRNFFKEDKTKQLTTWKELIDGSLGIIQPMLLAKNIHVYVMYGEDHFFMTYPREITQVILNILKNAEDILLENVIPNPQIWIRTFYENGRTSLEIEDNGGGIPPELIDKVFDPYFSTKFDKDGTGIGLYMSKTIIEQHSHGKLTIINTVHGACFKIQLPIENQIDSEHDLSDLEKLEY